MKKLLFLISIFGMQGAFAQKRVFKYNLELGMVTNGLPSNYKYENLGNAMQKYRPIIGPIAGIHVALEKRHWGMGIGLQYQKTGYRNKYTADWPVAFDNPTILVRERNKYELIYHQVNLPVYGFYKINKGSLKPRFYLGVRTGYIVAGHDKQVEISNSEDPEYASEFRDYGKFKDFYIGPRRLQFQAMAGTSVELCGMQISVNYYRGGSLFMMQDPPVPNSCFLYCIFDTNRQLALTAKIPVCGLHLIGGNKRVKP